MRDITIAATQADPATPEEYELCFSFTRHGLPIKTPPRVPWILVLYKTGAEKGTRFRVKPVEKSEVSKAEKSATNLEVPLKFGFLAREDAYVDNFSCWGRVILRSSMSKTEADKSQQIIETTPLSEMVDGVRDCQKWNVEVLRTLGFWPDVVNTFESIRKKNIWEIENIINESSSGLKFKRSRAYKTRKEVEEAAETEEEKKAREALEEMKKRDQNLARAQQEKAKARIGRLEVDVTSADDLSA